MRNWILLLFFSLALTQYVSAQVDTEPPVVVKRSRNRVRIDGKQYYVHIVKKGETLYSLSRAYRVSQSEIAVANPDIYSGLKVGQALKIPVRPAKQKEDERYIYHIVKKKETLFGISRRYNLTVDELLAANPEAKDGIQVSQVLLIPRYKLQEHSEVPAADSVQFIIHEVQPKEGLFAISRRYGVDADLIKLYNRDKLRRGVKLGTSLRIPIITPQPDTVSVADTVAVNDEPVDPCNTSYSYNGETFNIAMLLPFTREQTVQPTDSTDIFAELESADAGRKRAARSADKRRITSGITLASLDFYEGFLLALDSVKRKGVSVNLSVFDTKRSPAVVERLSGDGSLDNADLIIGPFAVEELKPLVELADSRSIPLVSPFYNGPADFSRYPNVIELNQNHTDQLKFFIQDLRLQDTCRYIIVYDKYYLYSESNRLFDSLITQKADSLNIPLTRFNYMISMLKPAQVQDSLSKLLSHNSHNVLIISSDDEPFVTDFLGQLYAVKSFYNFGVSVYGPSRWRMMNNLSVDYLFNLDIRIFTPFYIDYRRSEVKRFIASFREHYRAEPNRFSFLGFDVGLYFLNVLKEYGKEFIPCLPRFYLPLLQSPFRFELNPAGSAKNRHQTLINYRSNFEILPCDE